MKTMWLWVPNAEWDSGMKARVIEMESEPKGPGCIFEVEAKNAIHCNALVRRYLELEASGVVAEAKGTTRALLAITHPALAQVKRVSMYVLKENLEEIEEHAPWGETKKVKRMVTRLVKE